MYIPPSSNPPHPNPGTFVKVRPPNPHSMRSTKPPILIPPYLLMKQPWKLTHWTYSAPNPMTSHNSDYRISPHAKNETEKSERDPDQVKTDPM